MAEKQQVEIDLNEALVKAEVELKQIETASTSTNDTGFTIRSELQLEPRPSEVDQTSKIGNLKMNRNLQRAVEKVREQVVFNPKMDREVAQKVEQALKEATQLQQVGRESTGRESSTTSIDKSRSRIKTNRITPTSPSNSGITNRSRNKSNHAQVKWSNKSDRKSKVNRIYNER